jgi:D-alanyl-lipoteichoic acid acyltransferase DltB (MBOAT superfamily)
VVLADGIFAPVVDRFYGAPASFGLLDAWTAVLSFSGQIYFDFSGYSLCAIGLALCFGYSFPENFHHPYAARSVSDFWRRWHISLSSWLRDYLYIPLGGNRHGTTRTCIALMLTMLIGGLWHGASWMFVLWGCLHGSYLLVELLLRRLNMVKTRSVTGPYRLSEFFIFILITLTWIPFRASNPAEAFAVAQSLVDGGRNSTPMAQSQDLIALTSIFITVGWHIFLRDRNFATVMSRLAQSIQLGVFSVCLICLYLYSGGDQRAFLYFQF